jgi:Skp family chaperone for outer membrane proteins
MVLFNLIAARRWSHRLALVSGAVVLAGAATAQTAPGPAYGPPIAGVCFLTRADAIDHSQAGVSANQQMTQFGQGIEAELKAQRTAIESDDKALAGQKANLSPAEFDRRVAQLRQRYADLNRTQSIRAAQLRLTSRDAINQLGKILQPSLTDTITARRCSAVFERSVTYGASDAMDITAMVIQKMDALQSVIALRLATPEAAQAAR